MKICLAQTKSKKGDLAQNIQEHLRLIQSAAVWGTDLILFPELSLTGYEPSLAKSLARPATDPIFDPFQNLADKNKMIIAVGMPLQTEKGIVIGMLIFQPKTKRRVYAKQILHEDEMPFFVSGDNDLVLNFNDQKISFGICYESLQRSHFQKANELGATTYLACVSKSDKGIAKAYTHFSNLAGEFSMPICMVNNVGVSDDFIAAGQTAAWNRNGELIDRLDAKRSGILWIDLATKESKKQYFDSDNKKIELAQPTDLPRLIQLFQNAKTYLDQQKIFQWTDTYPSKTNIEKDLKDKTLYVLKNNEALMSAVTLNEEQDIEYQSIDWKFRGEKILVIHRLVVDPIHQRRGYAKQIMDFAEDFGSRHNYDAIRLDTYTQNKVSFEFYKKRNYISRGAVFFSGRRFPFYCLEKNLNSTFTQ